MPGNNLDKSLDDILAEKRHAMRPRRTNAGVSSRTQNKSGTGPARWTGQSRGAGSAAVIERINLLKSGINPIIFHADSVHSGSKIIVSNLPFDVTEPQIKDYFGQTIGPIRRVSLTYDPNGKFCGVCTILFVDSNSGAKAAKEMDGVRVDNKPLKIEVVVEAKLVPPPPRMKSISERISQPRSHTQPLNGRKQMIPSGPAATRSRNGRGDGVGRVSNQSRGPRPTRVKNKTVEQLDAEMADYWETSAETAGVQ